MPFQNSVAVTPRSLRTNRSSRTAKRLLSLTLSVTFGLAVRSAVHAAGQEKKTEPTPQPTKTVCEALQVTIVIDGASKSVATGPSTVADLLSAQKIHLGKLDRTSLALSAMVGNDSTITITRVRSEDTTTHTPIPFATKQTFSSGLKMGDKSVKQAGVKGDHVVTYHSTYVNNVQTSHRLISETRTAPKTQVEVVGTRGMTMASRGYFGGRRIIEMVATGYGPNGNGRWGMQTASGLRPGFGVVAVDPRFIPLGTRLYIDGYGYAVAGDTGGAIKGNRIDLGHDTNAEAEAEGRKKVRVLILN